MVGLGLCSLDFCLALALGALWLSGLASRATGLTVLVVLVLRHFFPGTPRENGSKHLDVKPNHTPITGGKNAVSGTFVPSNGLLDFRKDEVYVTETEGCSCTCYVLWKPTDDPDRVESGAYINSWYFAGKKRIWEIRWQIRVKRKPKRPLVFGLELAQYVPVSGWAQRIQQLTVSTLRNVVGQDLYHSCGDDPSRVEGEAERPVFVMPLWAFDQVIVSEPGEEPNIRHIQSLGALRTSNRAQFIKQFSRLQLHPDKVYTFAFWSISRFVDVVNWQLLGVVPGGVSFNTFAGAPPVHVVIYEVNGVGDDSKDRRHLRSRKTYYFNMALWSTKDPPSQETLKTLLPEVSNGGSGEEVAPGDGERLGWCCWR